MTDTRARGERMLVYYPGHLGPEPTVETRGRLAQPWSGPGVRDLPAEVGAGLVRYSGFVEALEPGAAAARYGLATIDPQTVTTVKHGDRDLVLLTREAVRRLRALAAAGAKRAKTTTSQAKES